MGDVQAADGNRRLEVRHAEAGVAAVDAFIAHDERYAGHLSNKLEYGLVHPPEEIDVRPQALGRVGDPRGDEELCQQNVGDRRRWRLPQSPQRRVEYVLDVLLRLRLGVRARDRRPLVLCYCYDDGLYPPVARNNLQSASICCSSSFRSSALAPLKNLLAHLLNVNHKSKRAKLRQLQQQLVCLE